MMTDTGSGISITQNTAPLVGELPELAGLNDHLWQEAVAGSQIAHCPAHTKLIRYGEPVDKLFIVLSGVIKVYESASSGREISLYRSYDGEVCMLSLTRMLHRAAQCAEAITEEDTRLLMVPREYFDRLIAESEGFRLFILSAMSSCLDELMQLTAEVGFNNLDFRLAQLIRRLAEHGASIRLKLTHQAIANELGTTREVISRLLKDFEKAGYIKLGRGRIQVLAPDKLNLLCNRSLKQTQLSG